MVYPGHAVSIARLVKDARSPFATEAPPVRVAARGADGVAPSVAVTLRVCSWILFQPASTNSMTGWCAKVRAATSALGWHLTCRYLAASPYLVRVRVLSLIHFRKSTPPQKPSTCYFNEQ